LHSGIFPISIIKNILFPYIRDAIYHLYLLKIETQY
ncbi:hypothetical protein M141_3908, partial [Bacteroides fragilis str. S38L5]